MADENETTGTESTSQPTGIPPEAYERQKAETAAAKEEARVATDALAQTVLVDKIYEHFSGLEDDAKPVNPYEAAKAAARRIPSDTENVPEAVAALVAEMSSLQPQTVAEPPPPPMAGDEGGQGPQPGAAGGQLETGPFPINSKEFKEYFKEHGSRAANVAIANGQFFPSDDNASAQNTLDSV